MKRLILIGLISSIVAISYTAVRAQGGSVTVTFSGYQLLSNWQPDPSSPCPGVWDQYDSSTNGFFPPGYLFTDPIIGGTFWVASPNNCNGGTSGYTGIGLHSAPTISLPAYSLVANIVISYVYPQPVGNWPGGTSFILVGTTMPNTISLFLPVVLSGTHIHSPLITSIAVTYIAPADATSTLPPTWTPAPGTTPTDLIFPTNPPGPTDFPTGTPEPLNTIVADALPTIGDINNCAGDPFNPCGTMPYAMVYLPTLNLPSPSPLPTVDTPTPIPITLIPSATLTPTGTLPTPTVIDLPTITPYATPPIDLNGIATTWSDQFGTLMPAAGAQITFNSTPQGVADVALRLAAGAVRAIRFINAIQGTDLNTAGGMITAIILILIFIILVEVFVLILPFLLMIVRIVIQAIGAFKPF